MRLRHLFPFLALVGCWPVRAAEEAAVVALPPFMVEEVAKGPPWRYGQSPDFEILSRCDDRTTRELNGTYYRLHRLLDVILPAQFQVRHDVAKTMIYYDEALRPAASQEVIAQMLRSHNPVPSPFDDSSGGRGIRSLGSPQPRYTFVPNMRLWDKDSMAVFAIVRAGDVDSDNVVLTPDYVGYLVKTRTPTLPAWFLAGFLGVYPKFKFHRDSLTLEAAEWISEAETRLLKNDPKTARPPLPLMAFLRAEFAVEGQTREQGLKLWASQAELFYRWGIETEARRAAFWKFLERTSTRSPTEAMVQECFNMRSVDVTADFSAFMPVAVRKALTLRPPTPMKQPMLALRNATESEIARIKGDWERLEIAYVRHRYPALAPKYVEQARRTLLRAYEHDDRDPRLLAIMGLTECDAENDTGARPYLESAAAIGVVRPRAWLELARLRFAEHAGARLNADQLAEILKPLFTARSQAPAMAEVYELIADAWTASTVRPTAGNLAVLSEGVNLFPRRTALIARAAGLFLTHGFTEDATNLIDLGQRLPLSASERERFVELQGRLAVKK